MKCNFITFNDYMSNQTDGDNFSKLILLMSEEDKIVFLLFKSWLDLQKDIKVVKLRKSR